ncbi:MAG TPA: hypothetical protein VGC76_12595 [Pyrinomonadaceae bacterium]
MPNIFILKLFLTPSLIGLASLVERKWGAAISGWLIGLPLSSAPIMLFLALEHGTSFASDAARSILLGLISVAVFCLTYSWIALRFNWFPTVIAGWATFFTVTFFLQTAALDAAAVLLFIGVSLVLSVTYALLPKVRKHSLTTLIRPRWDVPLRMIIAAGFVFLLTGMANALGPHLSGLLVPFPLFATILSVFTHRFQGSQAVLSLLRGVVMGAFSFAVFFLTVALTIEPFGVASAFILATVAALSLHGVTLLFLKRNQYEENF